MSRFGQVEMSQSRPPELRALRCGDGNNGGDDHDEHAGARSAEDHPARRRSDAEGSVKLPKDSGSVAARSNGW